VATRNDEGVTLGDLMEVEESRRVPLFCDEARRLVRVIDDPAEDARRAVGKQRPLTSDLGRAHDEAESCRRAAERRVESDEPAPQQVRKRDVLRIVRLRPAKLVSESPCFSAESGRGARRNGRRGEPIERLERASARELPAPYRLVQAGAYLRPKEWRRD
jgi:hypothetical protein